MLAIDFHTALGKESTPQDRAEFADWLEEQGDPRAEVVRRIDAEGVEAVVGRGEQSVVRHARLKMRQFDLFGADCAEYVLPAFEQVCPGDMRPREAIQGVREKSPSLAILSVRSFMAGGDANHWLANKAAISASFAARGGTEGAMLAAYCAASTASARLWGEDWEWILHRLAEYIHFDGARVWTPENKSQEKPE